MRFFVTLLFLSTSLLSYSQSDYNSQILAHREKINKEFGDSSTSILPKEELLHFHGLEFYSPTEEFLIAVKFKRIKNGEVIGFATSTDRIAKYRPYGKLKFKVNGTKCKLTVYEPAIPIKGYENHLFLPFKDLTNSVTTYGGGRYLDLDKSEIEKKFNLDFNLCYNPYCSYSNAFSCPYPPEVNHLNVEIKAGVKDYGEH